MSYHGFSWDQKCSSSFDENSNTFFNKVPVVLAKAIGRLLETILISLQSRGTCELFWDKNLPIYLGYG